MYGIGILLLVDRNIHNKTIFDSLSTGYNLVVILVLLCVKRRRHSFRRGKFVNYPYQPINMSGTTDELSKVPTKMPATTNEEDQIPNI